MAKSWRWLIPVVGLTVALCGVGVLRLYLHFSDEEALELEGFRESEREFRCRPGTSFRGDDHSFNCVDVDGCTIQEKVIFERRLLRTCPEQDGGTAR
ncbi:hypothetical protein [Hyalangium rubrum]|uniref:Lipoprotein n=1 Tax=Hyalangium rubrum TaxID=3103134 RepID=A0ABU5H4J1_9BACT|nr:hypothetical protein [Hyalangium sp. s54d21]MDY7228022.1 hypothetical protein [Hyalangium sp. s54d21]